MEIDLMRSFVAGISDGAILSQMSVAALPHTKLMRAIELLGTRVAPLVRLGVTRETLRTDAIKS